MDDERFASRKFEWRAPIPPIVAVGGSRFSAAWECWQGAGRCFFSL